ncbi:MAG: acyl-CoA dehydrogenase family protein, partial [Gaiellaceae bacterium]
MIPTVPELPADVRELKARVAEFIEREVYPLEQRVAEVGRIDPEWASELRRRSWAEGFGMLNMPEEAGGSGLSMLAQAALEEESGKATNGLGFAVVDRGPAELWDIATPAQREQFVAPVLRGEYREAWAVTEPGAGSDVSAIAATAKQDEDEWVLNGEKWFVTSEGDPGFYLVLAVADGQQTLFIVEPWRPGLEITKTPGFLHDPYLDHHPENVLTNCRVPEDNRIPEGGG